MKRWMPLFGLSLLLLLAVACAAEPTPTATPAPTPTATKGPPVYAYADGHEGPRSTDADDCRCSYSNYRRSNHR